VTDGSGNTAVGWQALYAATLSGSSAFGSHALEKSDGWFNNAFGNYALFNDTSGQNNTAMGNSAGWQITGFSDRNTFMGNYAGANITNGSDNLILGYNAASSLTSGSGNIAIGKEAQVPSATGSNQLSIGNLILGDMANNRVTIGTASTSATTVGLHVATTDAILLPSGTDAQQPGTPANGMIRYNTDNDKFEAYENGAWADMIASVKVL
jgi:hypothetical protein